MLNEGFAIAKEKGLRPKHQITIIIAWNFGRDAISGQYLRFILAVFLFDTHRETTRLKLKSILCAQSHSIEQASHQMNSEVNRIAEMAEAGERMIERLRKKAFLPEARKGLAVRYGIAEAAQLLGCSTNRIRMAENDGRLPPPPATKNGRRPGYSIEDLLNMRQVLDASPARHSINRRLSRFKISKAALANRLLQLIWRIISAFWVTAYWWWIAIVRQPPRLYSASILILISPANKRFIHISQ